MLGKLSIESRKAAPAGALPWPPPPQHTIRAAANINAKHMASELYEKGMATRRKVLGDAYIEK